MNYQMPYYNFPPYKYTPSMYQINMFNPETGQAVNSSTVFYRQEDVNWYLACVSNLGSIFKIIVCYQNCVWKNKYEYEIQQGRYIYHPPPVEYAQPPEFVFQGTQTENIDTEVPVSTEVPNETEVPVSTEVANETDGNPLNVTYNNHATSGFNFHFDPPTNLNLVINPTKVDLPDPDGPTIAIFLFLFIERFNSLKVNLSELGYLKDTFLNVKFSKF